MMTRSLNLDHPNYQEGAAWANKILDIGDGRRANDWISLVEELAQRAHEREDVPGYHLAMGFIHTLREYVEDQAG